MADDLDTLVADALARGETARAVGAIQRALGPELRAYLRATMRDADAASEVHAELAEQLTLAMGRYRRESSVRTFVYAVAWNLVRAHRRRAARERRRFGGEADHDAIAAPGPRTPTPAYRRTTAKERLRAARAQLDHDELNLIVLRVDRDMGWKEIGEILGTGGAPAETAVLRKRFERLVKRLRDWMDGDGE